MEPLLLREREVCERLGVSRMTVRNLMNRGELPYVHIGRALRFRVSDVNEYVERLADGREENRNERS